MPSCCYWLRRSRGSIAKHKKHENRREFSNPVHTVNNVYDECESDEYADIPLSPSKHDLIDENSTQEGERPAPLPTPPAINRSSTSPKVLATLPRTESTTTPRSISISIPSNEVESEYGTKSDKLKEKASRFTFNAPSFSMASPISLHSKRIRKSGSKNGLESERKSSPHAPASPSSREIKRTKSGESTTNHDDNDDIDPVKGYKIPVINGIEGLEDRYLKAVNLVVQPSDWTEVSAFRKYKVKACYHHVGGEAHAQLWMAIEIDQPIDRTMCLGNELDLWPKWNKVVTLNEPLEPLTTYNTKNRWLRSIAHGLYKTETLMDLRRFINHDHGFYVEHILPVDKKHPCYREKPEKGYYREELESALVLMPINDGKSTLWISYTQAQFPVPLNRWFGRIIIPTVCREIASQVLHGCAKIPTEEGKIWRDRITEDKLKIYSELKELTPQPYSFENLPQLTKLWSQI